jgi:hypothetical protein
MDLARQAGAIISMTTRTPVERMCRFSSSMDVTPSSPVAWSGFTPTRKPMLTIRALSSCSGSLMGVLGSITVLSRSGRSSPTQPRSTPPREGYRFIRPNHYWEFGDHLWAGGTGNCIFPIDLINVRLNMSEANNGQALSHPQHNQHLPDGHQRTMIWR